MLIKRAVAERNKTPDIVKNGSQKPYLLAVKPIYAEIGLPKSIICER